MTVQAGPTSTDAGVGTQFRLDLHNIHVYARAEWLTRIADNVRLVSGVDVHTGTYSARYKGPSIGQSEGNPNENPDDQIGVEASGSILQPGVYADLAVDLGPLTRNAAVRGDYYDEIRNYSIDPRFSRRVRRGRAWPVQTCPRRDVGVPGCRRSRPFPRTQKPRTSANKGKNAIGLQFALESGAAETYLEPSVIPREAAASRTEVPAVEGYASAGMFIILRDNARSAEQTLQLDEWKTPTSS